MINIIWEFQIDPSKRLAFEGAYGSNGTWSSLFKQANGYHGTLLLRDSSNPNKYFTIDRWDESNSFEHFKIQFHASYEELDRTYENLTLSEKKIGIFDVI